MRLVPGTVVDTPEGPRLLPPGMISQIIIFCSYFHEKNCIIQIFIHKLSLQISKEMELIWIMLFKDLILIKLKQGIYLTKKKNKFEKSS